MGAISLCIAVQALGLFYVVHLPREGVASLWQAVAVACGINLLLQLPLFLFKFLAVGALRKLTWHNNDQITFINQYWSSQNAPNKDFQLSKVALPERSELLDEIPDLEEAIRVVDTVPPVPQSVSMSKIKVSESHIGNLSDASMEEIPLSPRKKQSPVKTTPRQPNIYSSQKKQQQFSTPKEVKYPVNTPDLADVIEIELAPMQPVLPSEPIQTNLLLKSFQQLKKSLQRSKESEPEKKEKEFSPVWSSMKHDSANN